VGDLVVGVVGIAGVFLGLFADRLLQRYGKVRCEMDPIEFTIGYGKKGGTDFSSLPVPFDLLPGPEYTDQYGSRSGPPLSFRLTVKLFNEKEVKTGLRDVCVVFEGEETVECIMKDRATWRSHSASTMDELEVVNLPSREWVTYNLTSNMGLENAAKLTRATQGHFQGYFPDGRLYRKRVPLVMGTSSDSLRQGVEDS
jgi:hypothetical protein